ncbi:MAG: hypothetical protein R2848_01735 [Thermomicrobiales bacterium]
MLGFGEQLVAPIDRSAETLLSGGEIPQTAVEEAWSAAQAALHGRERHVPELHGGQLERERNPVQAGADGDNIRHIRAGNLEIWPNGVGTLQE